MYFELRISSFATRCTQYAFHFHLLALNLLPFTFVLSTLYCVLPSCLLILGSRLQLRISYLFAACYAHFPFTLDL